MLNMLFIFSDSPRQESLDQQPSNSVNVQSLLGQLIAAGVLNQEKTTKIDLDIPNISLRIDDLKKYNFCFHVLLYYCN